MDEDTLAAASAQLAEKIRVLKEDVEEAERARTEDERFDDWRAHKLGYWGGAAPSFALPLGTKDSGKPGKDEDHRMEERFVYLFVDSNMRNRTLFPNASDFRLGLGTEVNNVTKAELVQAALPMVDPTVNSSNNRFRFSYAPHSTVREVRVPPGAYLPSEFVVELQRQLNQDRFATELGAGTFVMDNETGFAMAAAGGMPAGEIQFRVSFVKPRQLVVVQLVDDDELPVDDPVFALHLRRRCSNADDAMELMGFNRAHWETEAAALNQYHTGTDTYYLTSEAATGSLFKGPSGAGQSATWTLDARYMHGLVSSGPASFRGTLAAILDIDPLNDADAAALSDTGLCPVAHAGYFGILLLRDPATLTDRVVEVNNNTFPVRKTFRDPRSRISHLHVKIRRSTGETLEFGESNFVLTLRLTVRTMQNKHEPIAAR